MKEKLRYIISFMIIFIFWIILTEKVNMQNISVGILISGLIFYINRENISYIKGKRLLNFKKIKYIFAYIILLLKEITIANFQVAKIVLGKNLDISPTVVRFNTKLKDDFLKAILANSITLTPGTLTIKVIDNTFIVHCLLREHGEYINNSKFEQILLKIEE